jgi:hypothetical protein
MQVEPPPHAPAAHSSTSVVQVAPVQPEVQEQLPATQVPPFEQVTAGGTTQVPALQEPVGVHAFESSQATPSCRVTLQVAVPFGVHVEQVSFAGHVTGVPVHSPVALQRSSEVVRSESSHGSPE